MLNHARRANPLVPWRVVGLALALIALPGVIAVAVILLSTSSTTSSGGGTPQVTAPASTTPGGSAACARTDRDPVNSTRSGARDKLVPPGATAILLCRYELHGHLVLERSITSAATVAQLSRDLNALPPASGAMACPLDDGETLTADFGYPSGPENPVGVRLSGCQSVTNGHVHRLGLDHPVIEQLDRLAPWLGTVSGRLEVCGGPAPGKCSTGSFRTCYGSRCYTADQIAILHSQGAQHPNVRLRHGRFRVRLEPGRYRLVLLGDGRQVHGKVLETIGVRVRLGHTTRARFEVSLP